MPGDIEEENNNTYLLEEARHEEQIHNFTEEGKDQMEENADSIDEIVEGVQEGTKDFGYDVIEDITSMQYENRKSSCEIEKSQLLSITLSYVPWTFTAKLVQKM